MSRLTKGQMTVLKKTVAVLTTLTTVLSLAGVAAFPSRVTAATPGDYGLTEGNTISASGTSDPDIYIVNAQGYKRLFLNPVIFNFYGHLGGFPAVRAVSATTRDAFPTSGLFRNCEANDEKVYGVEVNGEDTGVLHWVNTSGAQAVADDPNFFSKVFCINNNEFNWYAKGSNYTSVSQVPNYSRSGLPASGPLSASLAADNPASGTLVETQALADLAHFQVNGSGAVTTVELKRLGISADSTLEDVFLFVNGVRVSDSGNVSSGMVTFNNAAGLFTAPAVLVVKSDIAATTSGQTVGIQLTKLNTSAVSVSGNLFTIAAVPASLANYLLVASGTGPGDIDPQNEVAVWKGTANISSEDVYFRRLTIREIGSIDNADVRNFRLFVDGVQVATATSLNSEGYVTFILNHRILIGSSREIKVVADVVGGASRTMQFSLRGSYDIEFVDEAFNVGVESTSTFPISMTASSISNNPTVTVSKATNSPSGDVVATSTGVTLGRFEAKAFGEAVKIETLHVTASVSNVAGGGTVDGLTNGRVLINGAQYGSTATLLNNASRSFTVNYTVALGATAIVEVVADLKDSTGDEVGTSDIVSVLIDGGNNNNAQGVSSATTIDAPTANVEGNNLTIVAGTVTLSKQTGYSDQNVTLPQTAKKIGAWVLTGSSAETVNLTNLSFDVDNITNDTLNEDDLTNVYVKYGSLQTTAKSSLSADGQDNDYSISYTLQKNEVLVIELYADIGSNATADDSFNADLTVTGTGATSGAAISGVSDKEGQTVTYKAGTFTTSVDSGTQKLAQSNSGVNAGSWRFRGENDSFTISELKFKVASGSNQQDAVSSVTLKDGGTTLGTAFLSANGVSTYVATFTGLNIAVGAEKALTVDVNTADVNTVVTTGKNVGLTLDSAKYRNSAGTEATDSTDRAGANIYVHDAYPSLAKNDVGTSLSVGTQTLAQLVATPVGSVVGLQQFRFDITKAAGISIASASGATDFELYANGAPLDVASVSHTGLGTNQTSGTLVFEFASEQILSSATTYRLEVNVLSATADKSINVTLNASAATASPAAAASVTTGSAIVWTDRSASSHSYTTSDWMNGFLVPGLPMSWGKTS